jgi:hypothetical protein
LAATAAEMIYTGGERGSYFQSFGPLLLDTIQGQWLEYELATSAGSGENIQHVIDNPLAIGMTQTDVLAAAMTADPSLADKVTVIRNDVANECLYAVVAPENSGRLTNWGDVRAYARRLRIATGPEQSGAALTFRFLQSLDEKLAAARNVQYMGNVDDAIAAVLAGDADIAFFVQFADPDNARFQTINDAEMSFIPVVDRALLRQTYGSNQRVYVPQEVKVTSADLLSLGGVTKIVTACTPLAYITGSPSALPAGSAEQADLEELISLIRDADVATLQPQEGWFQSWLDSAAEVTEDSIADMLDTVEQASEQK